MLPDWIVLIPPLLVFVLAFLTHRIKFSLFIGIICGCLIATNFAPIETIKMAFTTIWKTTELQNITSFKTLFLSENLMMFSFLLLLGIIIVLLSHTGGANAYRTFVERKIKNKKDAEKSSLILSLFFFLDDYFGCATVGSVMHQITDKFKIPRAKLAFLVNSIAAPLCVLVPISSWSATIMMNMYNAGISDIAKSKPILFADTFYLFLGTIPFSFYAIIIILSAWFIVISKISFGRMYKHEKIAKETGNLFAGKIPVVRKIKNANKNNKSMFDFLLPISTLILSLIFLILYTGNYYLLGGTNSFATALKTSQFVFSLFVGSLFTLILSTITYSARKKLKIKEIPLILKDGIKLLGPSIFVLVLAWSLADILRFDLKTGEYLANTLVNHINIQLLPIMFFVITSLTGIAIGSAWGSLAIMIPIATQMLSSFSGLVPPINPSDLPIIYPLFGAIFSGAVIGNHISPASDTMVMSAASSGAYHMDHVRTQHTYSIPTIFSASIAFLLSGYMVYYNLIIGSIFSLAIGLIINFGILFLLSMQGTIRQQRH